MPTSCSPYFYPRPPRGGRRHLLRPDLYRRHFYPRPPRGGRPKISDTTLGRDVFLSTPSARRATCFRWTNSQSSWVFLSTPSARRATAGAMWRKGGIRFLSTPSARRATGRVHLRGLRHRYFYPRPPRGGRPRLPRRSCRLFLFLSTPSARRATLSVLDTSVTATVFLSTPSARRATREATS